MAKVSKGERFRSQVTFQHYDEHLDLYRGIKSRLGQAGATLTQGRTSNAVKELRKLADEINALADRVDNERD